MSALNAQLKSSDRGSEVAAMLHFVFYLVFMLIYSYALLPEVWSLGRSLSDSGIFVANRKVVATTLTALNLGVPCPGYPS